MRALWSRASQTPGTCRCISRVLITTAGVRRVGQSGIRRWWAFGGPTSTFVYTTIFAAGLTLDTSAKRQKENKWDVAFEHLRDALDDTTTQTQRRNQGPKAGEAREHENTNPTTSDTTASHELPKKYAQMRSLHEENLEWPANTGRDLVPHHLPPQSRWAPNVLRLASKRKRYTWKKLAVQELSTALLIHKLVKDVNLVKFSKSCSQSLQKLSPHIMTVASLAAETSQRARQEIIADIDRIQSMDVNSTAREINEVRTYVGRPGVPSYYQDANGDFHTISEELTSGIEQLLLSADRKNELSVALQTAKICHNLLVSSASPNLEAFNTLIRGFKLWHKPKLVDNVISAFFCSNIRANETTCQLILRYYTMENRPNDFSLFVARMRGVRGGLMLATPAVTINEASQDRLVRDSANQNKIYQKVYPTPMVYAALIEGVMKFAGFDRALDVYYELKRDGWGLEVSKLTNLLADCVRRADWEGGIYLWEEIRTISLRAKPEDMAVAYHTMLSLCSITGKTVAFNQILNEIARRGYDRKAIITAAMTTMKWAKHKKSTLMGSPAMTADNLMIAVSDYLNSSDASEELPEDEDEFGDRSEHGGMPDAVDDGATTDPKAAWESWVTHELGERPKDPEL